MSDEQEKGWWSAGNRDRKRQNDMAGQGKDTQSAPRRDETHLSERGRDYRAFEILDHGGRLLIECATQPSRYPAYHYLMDIIEGRTFGSAFTLVYSFMTVEVIGRNLSPVVHAISYGECGRIREYHQELYDRPPKGEPLIESITITAPRELSTRQNVREDIEA